MSRPSIKIGAASITKVGFLLPLVADNRLDPVHVITGASKDIIKSGSFASGVITPVCKVWQIVERKRLKYCRKRKSTTYCCKLTDNADLNVCVFILSDHQGSSRITGASAFSNDTLIFTEGKNIQLSVQYRHLNDLTHVSTAVKRTYQHIYVGPGSLPSPPASPDSSSWVSNVPNGLRIRQCSRFASPRHGERVHLWDFLGRVDNPDQDWLHRFRPEDSWRLGWV